MATIHFASVSLKGRCSSPGATGPITSSLFRLSKGTRSALVTHRLDAEGQVDALSVAPDREYQ